MACRSRSRCAAGASVQQLKEIRRNKSEDVFGYISRAEIIRSELRDASNEALPAEAFMDYVLDGLGNAYILFIQQTRYANHPFLQVHGDQQWIAVKSKRQLSAR